MTKPIEIPGYQIKKELGVGGMARVYLAVETKLERKVALKILSSAMSDNPRITKRFLKEAKTAAHLQHSNIVNIFDVGKHEGLYYIAMEHLQGSLKEKVSDGAKVKPVEALDITRDTARALAYAHSKGYVHRDIKPDNIMFRKDGAVVLVDFGIVKVMKEDEQSRLTRTGMSIGTPQYMSPEQIKARKLDGRSDIYSLGVVLYQMLMGRVPFSGTDAISIALKHTGEPVPTLPDKLKEFQPLLDKMLAKKPGDRVKDADGLIRLIDALKHKLKDKTEKINLPEFSDPAGKKRLPLYAALVILPLLLVGSVYLIQQAKVRREKAVWQESKNNGSEAALRRYLQDYPQGTFSREADQGLQDLKKEKQYNSLIKQAESYYREGKYRMATQKASAAASFKNTPQLEQLNTDIQKALEQEEEDHYNDLLQQVRLYLDSGDPATARKMFDMAKKIKVSDQLTLLEQKLAEQEAPAQNEKKDRTNDNSDNTDNTDNTGTPGKGYDPQTAGAIF